MKIIVSESQYRLLTEQIILPTKKGECWEQETYLEDLAKSKTFHKDLEKLNKDLVAMYNRALKEKGIHNEWDKYYVTGWLSDYGFKSYGEAEKVRNKWLESSGMLYFDFLDKYNRLITQEDFRKSKVLKTYTLYFHFPPTRNKDGKLQNVIKLDFKIYDAKYTLQPVVCKPEKFNVNNFSYKPKPTKRVVNSTSSVRNKPAVNSSVKPTTKPDIKTNTPNQTITQPAKQEPIKTNFSATFGQDGRQETRYFKNFDEWKKFYDSTKGKFGFINGTYNQSETESSMSLKGTPSDWGL